MEYLEENLDDWLGQELEVGPRCTHRTVGRLWQEQ
jgi:hypothetical protein